MDDAASFIWFNSDLLLSYVERKSERIEFNKKRLDNQFSTRALRMNRSDDLDI